MSSWPVDSQQDLAQEYYDRQEKRLAVLLGCLFPQGFIMFGKLSNGEYVRASYNITKGGENESILREKLYAVMDEHVRTSLEQSQVEVTKTS